MNAKVFIISGQNRPTPGQILRFFNGFELYVLAYGTVSFVDWLNFSFGLLPELSKLSVSDHTDKEESMSHSLKTTDSHLTSIVVKTEGIQRCCSYPAPSQTRQRSIWASEASLLERLPSLSNCRKSVSTLQTRRKEAIREYVENPQRNFDVGASKAMMFDKWIRSQQESC